MPVTDLTEDYKKPAPERMSWLLKAPLHKDLRDQYERALAALKSSGQQQCAGARALARLNSQHGQGRPMSLQSVRADLAARAPELDVMVTDKTTETVIIAAGVHGCEPGQIAKTLCIRVKDEEFLLVTKGDARLDNQKSKTAFGGRPRMLGAEDVLRLTSHEVGGVCPFGLPRPLKIYLDVSLRVYDEVIPAAGAPQRLGAADGCARLAELCGNHWVDACTVPVEV